MNFEELTDFAKKEHERLVNHYNIRDDPKTKYTIFTKLVEEMGELSEAILTRDSLQRKYKLKESDSKLNDELADVILCTLILAQELKIDIDKGLRHKMKKIKERKY